MSELLERYTFAQRSVIDAYWEVIRFTRTTGKISDGIKNREYEYWNKFEPFLVIRALSIHMTKYPNIKETYTRGILRNLMKGGASDGRDQGSYAPAPRTYPGGEGKRDVSAEEAFRRRLNGL